MDPREFVETRTRRYMAQALEEFEEKIEQPLDRVLAERGAHEAGTADLLQIQASIGSVKRTFRRKLQTLASDCVDLMPSDLQINGFEPVVRRTA